jgi:hypothetical protein
LTIRAKVKPSLEAENGRTAMSPASRPSSVASIAICDSDVDEDVVALLAGKIAAGLTGEAVRRCFAVTDR